MAFATHLSIAVILHHSLLARGIASRLMEFSDVVNVSIVDSEAPDIQITLQEQAPQVMIIDAGDSGVCQNLSLKQLFEWVPQAKIICLDHLTDRVHVFTSSEFEIASTEQLLNILQPAAPTNESEIATS